MQQYGNKYFSRRPPPSTSPDPRGGVNRSKFNFFQIKGNHECSNMVANILTDTPNQNSTFSEHGHIAEQIKGKVA